MSIFKKNTTKKEIETSLNEIQINLENNYKDLAIKAFKESSELVEKYHNESLIDEKAYGKYKGQLDVFSKRMEGYSHRLNVKYWKVSEKTTIYCQDIDMHVILNM